MKKILGLILVTIILASCGSQFNQSRYGRYMWNRSSGKNVTEEKEIVQEKSKEEINNKGEKEPISFIDEKENLDNNSLAKNNVISSTTKPHAKTSHTAAADTKKFAKEKINNTLDGIKNIQKRTAKLLPKNGLKGNGNSDLGNILTIILLVILVLLILTLLDEILGPTLMWLLSIVILVVIIYFLLKILGLID